jgi:hypothetical protein
VVSKSILLEVCEDDGCEGGKEGGALVYRAVVDRFPYLILSAKCFQRMAVSTYCLSASFEYGGAVEVLVVFDCVAVLDDAFCAAVGWRSAVLRHVNTDLCSNTWASHTRPM